MMNEWQQLKQKVVGRAIIDFTRLKRHNKPNTMCESYLYPDSNQIKKTLKRQLTSDRLNIW